MLTIHHVKGRKAHTLKELARKGKVMCGIVPLTGGLKVPVDIMNTSIYNGLYKTSYDRWSKIVSVHGVPIGVSAPWKNYTVLQPENKTFEGLEQAVSYAHNVAVTTIIPSLKKKKNKIHGHITGERVMCTSDDSNYYLTTGKVLGQTENKSFVLWDTGEKSLIKTEKLSLLQKDTPIKGQIATRFIAGAKVKSLFDAPPVVGNMIKISRKNVVTVKDVNGTSYLFSIGCDNIYELIYI